MSHAIPVFIAIGLCLAAAFVVSWDLWPLIRPALAAVHAETLAEARARHDSMLRARLVRTARPDGTAPSPAPGAVPLDRRTRDDLTVIHAGGMLLPDRPRETPEPGPFRIRPYYLKHEADKAAGRWLP